MNTPEAAGLVIFGHSRTLAQASGANPQALAMRMSQLGQPGGVAEADIRNMIKRTSWAGDPLWTIGTNVLALFVVAVLLWQAYLLLGS